MLERHRQEKNKPKKKRKIIIFVCDKFENYKASFNRIFHRVAALRFGVPIKAKRMV